MALLPKVSAGHVVVDDDLIGNPSGALTRVSALRHSVWCAPDHAQDAACRTRPTAAISSYDQSVPRATSSLLLVTRLTGMECRNSLDGGRALALGVAGARLIKGSGGRRCLSG